MTKPPMNRENLPDKEFKALVIRMLNKLGKEQMNTENFNKKGIRKYKSQSRIEE